MNTKSFAVNVYDPCSLKTDKLEFSADATATLAGCMVNANRVGRASFTARHCRPRGQLGGK